MLLLLTLSLAAAAPQDARAERIETYLEHMASLGRWNGTALVASDGEILAHGGYGFANHELAVPASRKTRYRIASVSKAFGAMAALMLSEQGKLDLDRPIHELLESCPESWAAITSDHLIHHTSGIPDYEAWFRGYSTQEYSDFMSADDAPQRIVERAKGMPLDFAPGTGFRYSNSAYVVLGYVIEAAAEESFEDYCQREIFERLGMADTFQDRHERILAHRATGYVRAPGVPRWQVFCGLEARHLVNAHYQRMEPPQPDAGLVTTAMDLYRWDQALYGESLVSEAALQRVFAPEKGSYGFGWFITDSPYGTVHQHSGGLPGFACHIYRIPDSRSTIILLGNYEHLDSKLIVDLLRLVHGASVPLPEKRSVVLLEPEILESYAGRYESSEGDKLGLQRVGDGLVLFHGDRRAEVYPESEEDFFYVFSPEGEEGRLRFIEDEGLILFELEDSEGQLVLEAAKL